MKNLLLVACISVVSSACLGPPSDRATSPDRRANNASVPTTSSANHNVSDRGTMDHSSMQSSTAASSAPVELQFLDTMVAHHQGAVEMATLAETRAQHAELKELAANIVADQEREIARMSQWRDQWFAEKPKAVIMDFPGMSHGMVGMDVNKLSSLKGNEFDLEFIRQMIPHHEGAVQMARSLETQQTRPELKELAADITSAQEAEIKQMREWLRSCQAR